MVQSFKEQQAVADQIKADAGRSNQITQLKACIRHYKDMFARITAKPIDPSADAILVRQDITLYISSQIDKCEKAIERHKELIEIKTRS